MKVVEKNINPLIQSGIKNKYIQKKEVKRTTSQRKMLVL
ncbi:hypothetical protein HMPREF9447_03598 [Bacteroides oleiciplenus YIT 12058]|uniref:Uncharacterized protein n=1 Tax=Bacteroides oleiciplenus YIT 12058 TaxID=742727 RepID=K9DXW8_9BACE|nr:hypothetical protein HMPREF9447_03598 [Bacteroides oleiciplenus YIT 12058]